MTECFVGRQPILDRNNQVYGYELLYRHSLDNAIGDVDRTVATSRVVMNAFVDIGLENVVGRHTAFVHVSEDFLLAPELTSFPPERVVLQISEPIAATPEVLSALQRLTSEGHVIALNGYRSDLPLADLLPYAEVVKLDALDLDNETIEEEIAAIAGGGRRVTLIAKRVETTERRNELAALGIDCFQGHFLARPEIVTGTRLPTNKLAILQLVSRISDPDLETSELEQLISTDPSLSFRVLRFVNSPLSGLSRRVDSIQQAVVLVGRSVIKNWVMLLAVASLDGAVPELVKSALIRARLCEQLAQEAKLPGRDAFFTVGLFSLMDAIMARPMDELLETLPFTNEIRTALAEHVGVWGEAVDCAEQLEQGAPQGAGFLGLSGERISDLYLEAIVWADEATAAVR
jgi:c-di-GMP phosphodiesterase